MDKRVFAIIGLTLFLTTSSSGQDDFWSSGRPDGHAPISVMGEHYHKKGEVMISYRYMPMWMDGNLSSSNSISNEDVLQSYMVVPKTMSMNMHMLGIMYAPTNNITLMVMGNHVANSMNLSTRMGVDFTTTSSGIGDLSFSGLVKILNKNRQSIHANVGLSIPTGNIDQRDNTPMMDNAQLAYPMQVGSGTFDPFFGATYLGQSNRISWGFQSLFKARIGTNTEEYALGNKLNTVAWGAIKASEKFSFSTSISYYYLEEIKGADPDLNPAMMPLFSAINSGRNQLDIGLGSNFYMPNGALKNLRVGIEVKYPLLQAVNGVQMKTTLTGMIGLQYSIGHNVKHE